MHTFQKPWYFSVVQASLEAGLWGAMDHITLTIGSEVGMQFTNLIPFVKLEISAIEGDFADVLTFYYGVNILCILN